MASREESIEERTRRIVGELEALVGDLVSSGTERVEAAEEEAEGRVSRFHDATAELDTARREITKLEADRETLPNLAYKASLDEDWATEDELKERYRAIRPALESLRERVGELEAEVAGLVGPNATARGDLDAMIHAHERVRDACGEAAAPLVSLQTRVSVLLSGAADPLVARHRTTGESIRSIRDLRSNDPEVRTRSLERRGIRPEYAGAKPKPGV